MCVYVSYRTNRKLIQVQNIEQEREKDIYKYVVIVGMIKIERVEEGVVSSRRLDWCVTL